MPDTTLHFAIDLYPPSAVQRAVEAFDGFATFSVAVGDDTIAVQVADADDDDPVADEFANFVLNETILIARAPHVDVSP